MKNRTTIILTTTLLALAAYTAYAENVTISTFYPSPYGSYQSLETTGDTFLATAAGNVGIGTGAATQRLDVRGNIRMGGSRSTLFTTGDVDAGNNPLAGHSGGIQFLTSTNGATNFWFPTDSAGTPVNPSIVVLGGGGSFGATIVDVQTTGTLIANNQAGAANGLQVMGGIAMEDAAGDAGTLSVDCAAGTCYAHAVYA